jgi:hypothetical protein
MMTPWRILAIVLGSALMIGELIRSWGQDRNLWFVVDDFLIGVPLVATGILMAKPTFARHCALCASFAAATGGLYPSFFGKLVDLSVPASSNIDVRLLTALLGAAFVIALAGVIATVRAAATAGTQTRLH